MWVRIGRHLPWVATQGISTHWIRHTILTWVERNFGYAVARAYAGHTDSGSNTGATATYVRASLSEVAAAVAALTGGRTRSPRPKSGEQHDCYHCRRVQRRRPEASGGFACQPGQHLAIQPVLRGSRRLVGRLEAGTCGEAAPAADGAYCSRGTSRVKDGRAAKLSQASAVVSGGGVRQRLLIRQELDHLAGQGHSAISSTS